MKIDVYLNNFFIKYNSMQKEKNKLTNLKLGFLNGTYNKDDLFILRGEPGFRDDLKSVLNIFKKKNYILTTHGYNFNTILSNIYKTSV